MSANIKGCTNTDYLGLRLQVFIDFYKVSLPDFTAATVLIEWERCDLTQRGSFPTVDGRISIELN